MENKDYILASGAVLHLSDAPWEKVVPLWSAVQMASAGIDARLAGKLILASPEVQVRISDLYAHSTYDHVQLSAALFNDGKMGPKLRMDQLEIWEKTLEFQLRSFFLTAPSSSTVSKAPPTESPRQP